MENKRMEIRRIDPVAAGKMVGLIYAVFGLFWGILLYLGTWIGYTTMFAGNMALPMGLGGMAIIIGPIFYGLFGFISAVIFSWLYNLLANKIGGVKVQI